MNSHLSEVSREISAGLERYTFQVATSGFLALATRAAGYRPILLQGLVGWYCISPRPDARDILSVKVTPGTEFTEIELLIKRGHYTVMSWLRNHKEVTFHEDDSVTCACHPEEKGWLVKMSLPDYGGEFA